jgi:hypothetical protein
MLTLDTLPAWLAALYSLGHAYPWARLLLAVPPDDSPRHDPVLTAALTVALSAGSLALIMLALAVSQVPPSFGLILALLLIIDTVGWVLLRRFSPSPRVARGPGDEVRRGEVWRNPAALAAIGVCVAIVLLTLFNAGYWPFVEDDTMTLYGPMALRYAATGQFSGAGLYDAYPPLVPLLMAFPNLAGGAPNEYTARFVVAALALAAIGAAYVLGRDLFGRKIGLAAAFLLASVPILTHWAASGYTDLPAGTYYALTVLFAWRLYRHPHPANALLTGLMAGLALLTKNGALLLICLLPAWIVYTHWTARWKTEPEGTAIRLSHALIMGGALLLGGGLWYVHTLAAYGVLIPATGWIDQADHSLRTLFGPALTPSHFMLSGVLGFAGLALPLWRLWQTRPAFDPHAALLVGFGVPFWFVWWWWFSYDLRFLLLIWPLFAVMGGNIATHGLDWLAARISAQHQRIAACALAAVLVLVAGPALLTSVDNKPELLAAPFMDDDARHTVQLGARWDVIGWVRAHVPADAPILVFDYRFVYHLMQDHARVDFATVSIDDESAVRAYSAWIVPPQIALPEWAADLTPAYEAGGYRVFLFE